MFGEELERLRKEKGLTQKELAELIGVPQPHVSNLESGKRQIYVLAAGTLYKLCDTLGVPLDHFRPFMVEVPVAKPKKRARAKKK